jgi:hypothetical protein
MTTTDRFAMNRWLRISAAAAVGVTVGVAGTLGTAAPAGADSAEDYFLNELYKTHQKWYWPFGEAYIIGVARGVCDAWAAGVPYPAEVDSLATAKRWTQRNTRFFIALSTASFCPDRYTADIPPEARLHDGK